MVAPDGTLSLNDRTIPKTIERKLITPESSIILLNRLVNRFAMFAGMVKSDIKSIIPIGF